MPVSAWLSVPCTNGLVSLVVLLVPEGCWLPPSPEPVLPPVAVVSRSPTMPLLLGTVVMSPLAIW